MTNQEITVVYKWTAKPGKADELNAIYKEVEKQMHETEPNALKVGQYLKERLLELADAMRGSPTTARVVQAQ